jgi:hypothetical protein
VTLMTETALLLIAVALAGQASAAGQPLDVARLDLSAPVAIVMIDAGQAPGYPVRLAWAPDGRFLYLRLIKRDRWGNERVWHFEIGVAGPQLRPLEREPAWVARYWAWKSALSLPGEIDFGISLESRVERKTATGSGAGGAIGQNSGDPYGPGSELGPQGQAMMQSAMQAQNVTTTTLKLKGQLLAEFVNTPVVPGLTYGWAPAGTAVIAHSSSKRRLVLMNSKGRKRDVAGTRDVLLPAWSEDGSRLAWVERSRQGALVVRTLDIATR